jgi:hypothetical protein
MLRAMTPQHLLDWQTYALLEPFGELRADYRAAQIVTMLANVNRDPKKRHEPYKVMDFLLDFTEGASASRTRTQTWQEQKGLLRMWLGGGQASTPKRRA